MWKPSASRWAMILPVCLAATASGLMIASVSIVIGVWCLGSGVRESQPLLQQRYDIGGTLHPADSCSLQRRHLLPPCAPRARNEAPPLSPAAARRGGLARGAPPPR